MVKLTESLAQNPFSGYSLSKANSLYVDGIVGKNTRAKLFSSNASSGNGSVSRGDSDTGLVDSIIAYAQNIWGLHTNMVRPVRMHLTVRDLLPTYLNTSGYRFCVQQRIRDTMTISQSCPGRSSKRRFSIFDTISDNDYSDHVGIYRGWKVYSCFLFQQ